MGPHLQTASIDNEPLLTIEGLSVWFQGRQHRLKIVHDVSLTLKQHEILGIVGETGCGKSVLGLSVMQLLPPNALISGRVVFRGLDLTALRENDMRSLRGKEIALIPQSPSTSLNPMLRIGEQIAEVFELHRGSSKTEARRKGLALLRELDLPDADNSMAAFPHQLSGGMNQRVLVAVGMAAEPRLVIVDEPTKGLDAVRKNKVVHLLRRLALKGVGMLLITHDFAVAGALAHRIAVMYAGEIVETGPTAEVLNCPRHPYTEGLLASIPSNGLKPIPGFSPSFLELPAGCRFEPRCSYAAGPICAARRPDMINLDGGRSVRCFLVNQS